jgi:hypothetical protein
VGFEPTPSDEDQNALSLSVNKISLESGALDRSAILTYGNITQSKLIKLENNTKLVISKYN